MPSGADWSLRRLLAAVDGFYGRYEAWPVVVRVPPSVLEGWRYLLTPESFAILAQQLELVPDTTLKGDEVIAQDRASGRSYNYAIDGFPDGWVMRQEGIETAQSRLELTLRPDIDLEGTH